MTDCDAKNFETTYLFTKTITFLLFIVYLQFYKSYRRLLGIKCSFTRVTGVYWGLNAALQELQVSIGD